MSRKLKTKKTLSKRIRLTRRNKIMKRTTRQSHFNAKESGNKTRGKRKSSQLSAINKKGIKKILPLI